MSKKRILVVDDETSITRLLKMNLELLGNYEVREENSGKRAFETAREFKPDLILLDVMMPDMDGGDVAAALRRDPALRKTPVVFLTAAVKKEELGASEGKIGGRIYIAKPLNVKGVISVIEKTLGK
jgi:two-component system, OmpR family, response regulator